MKITILYDNTAEKGFVSGWGFSALLDDNTLFDTGDDEAALLSNMHMMGVRPIDIDQVILSHEDSDHVGGVGILSRCGDVNVYLPAGASSDLKDRIESLNSDAVIIEVTDAVDIGDRLFVTEMLGNVKKEISLAVRLDKGLLLVTGCAHPGLDTIMDNLSDTEDIYAILGGFHDFSNLKTLADVDIVYPCHCTTMRNEMADMYSEKVRFVSAGTEINIGN